MEKGPVQKEEEELTVQELVCVPSNVIGGVVLALVAYIIRIVVTNGSSLVATVVVTYFTIMIIVVAICFAG